MRVDELARHMIVTSSNLATNLLIDAVGIEKRAEHAAGARRRGGRAAARGGGRAAYEEGINNRVTAEGWSRCCASSRSGRRSPRRRATACSTSCTSRSSAGIPAGLPDDARVANKTGEISTVGARRRAGVPPRAGAVRPRDPDGVGALRTSGRRRDAGRGSPAPSTGTWWRGVTMTISASLSLKLVDGRGWTSDPLACSGRASWSRTDTGARRSRATSTRSPPGRTALGALAHAALRSLGVARRGRARGGDAARLSRATCRAPSRCWRRIWRCFARRSGTVVHIAANGGYRSPGTAQPSTPPPLLGHGREHLQDRRRCSRSGEDRALRPISRDLLPGVWTRPFGTSVEEATTTCTWTSAS
jgi:hypothetical protein